MPVPTPGNLVSIEEHEAYNVEGLRKALASYTPTAQKKMIFKYVREIMPTMKKDFDLAENEALMTAIWGDIRTAEVLRKLINAIRWQPKEILQQIHKIIRPILKKVK